MSQPTSNNLGIKKPVKDQISKQISLTGFFRQVEVKEELQTLGKLPTKPDPFKKYDQTQDSTKKQGLPTPIRGDTEQIEQIDASLIEVNEEPKGLPPPLRGDTEQIEQIVQVDEVPLKTGGGLPVPLRGDTEIISSEINISDDNLSISNNNDNNDNNDNNATTTITTTTTTTITTTATTTNNNNIQQTSNNEPLPQNQTNEKEYEEYVEFDFYISLPEAKSLQNNEKLQSVLSKTLNVESSNIQMEEVDGNIHIKGRYENTDPHRDTIESIISTTKLNDNIKDEFNLDRAPSITNVQTKLSKLPKPPRKKQQQQQQQQQQPSQQQSQQQKSPSDHQNTKKIEPISNPKQSIDDDTQIVKPNSGCCIIS